MTVGDPQRAALTDSRWLQDQYVERGRSLRAIAKELGCSAEGVRLALAAHGIPRRSTSGAVRSERVASADELRRRYVDGGQTAREIADDLGCSPQAVSS